LNNDPSYTAHLSALSLCFTVDGGLFRAAYERRLATAAEQPTLMRRVVA